MLDLIIKNGSCYIDGNLKKQDIGIKNNKITEIGTINTEDSKEAFDAKNLTVLPGCIDTQVHFREPGSTDAEDLNSGSRAAIAGGITSVFEMPNTNPPTSNKVEFSKKLKLAENRMYCNYAFYFGATPDNQKELSDLKDLEGCCGIKLFAGSSTGDLLVQHEKDIEKVFQNSSKIVSVHSEDEEILNMRPDGIFLSNGQGDPAATGKYAIKIIQKLIKENIPIFGICLGHQILALALNAKTKKMKLGHRGANHPVKNLLNQKVEITSQNHGFEILKESLPKNVEITHKSLFDNCIEGIKLKNKPVFSVQYHPESNPGPQDSVYLFKQFINEVKKYVKKKRY